MGSRLQIILHPQTDVCNLSKLYYYQKDRQKNDC